MEKSEVSCGTRQRRNLEAISQHLGPSLSASLSLTMVSSALPPFSLSEATNLCLYCMQVLKHRVSAEFFLPGQVIGGQEARPHSLPYMAFLQVENPEDLSSCEGFLVREGFVMTAGHCWGR